MINIYDTSNVLLRAMTRTQGPSEHVSMRHRYEKLAHSTDVDIWVFEGKGGNERRRAVYPGYKMTRLPVAENHYANIDFFRQLVALSPAYSIACEGWEGDDVIAALARRFAHRAQEVTVHSNDGDFNQLADDHGVTLKGPKTIDYPARYVPLYKALVGDASDNIRGIPGFGPAAWEATQNFRPDLEDAVGRGDQRALLALLTRPKILAWLSDPVNVTELRVMYQITQFTPVPGRELEINLKPGRPDAAAADALLKRYFH